MWAARGEGPLHVQATSTDRHLTHSHYDNDSWHTSIHDTQSMDVSLYCRFYRHLQLRLTAAINMGVAKPTPVRCQGFVIPA